MNLQQLEYVVAVDKYRHFVRAAESCGVTQSTLSMMIRKLEEELDLVLFDRDAHPVRVTEAGARVIAQARVVLYHTEQLRELSRLEREVEEGEIRLDVIPTVASEILPRLFLQMARDCPGIRLIAREEQTCGIVERLLRADVDMAIMVAPERTDEFMVIPLYYERLMAYVSPQDPLHSARSIVSGSMPCDRLWLLSEGHCLRTQVMSLCAPTSGDFHSRYESGSLDTLIRIVDTAGGYTVIPELHQAYLCGEQQGNVRALVDPEVVREVSLVIRKDYVRERLVNELVASIRRFIPGPMQDARLGKFAIRL